MTIYTPNVPQANQQIAATQAPIEANFTYINTAMQVDHIWTDNLANTPTDGSHNTVSMPNQGSDITSMGTGIAAVIYTIGENIFSWNGAKQPVSGVTGTGTITITTSFQTIFTVPVNCYGFVSISNQANPGVGGPLTTSFHFFTINGAPIPAWFDSPYQIVGSTTLLTLAVNSGNVQVARTSGINYSAVYKYIYWPV